MRCLLMTRWWDVSWFSWGTVCVCLQFPCRGNDMIFWIFPILPSVSRVLHVTLANWQRFGFEFHLRLSPSAFSAYMDIGRPADCFIACYTMLTGTKKVETAVHDCNSWLSVWTLSCRCHVKLFYVVSALHHCQAILMSLAWTIHVHVFLKWRTSDEDRRTIYIYIYWTPANFYVRLSEDVMSSYSRSIHRTINNLSINYSIIQSVNQSINQSVNRLIDQSITQSISQSVSPFVNKPIQGGKQRGLKPSFHDRPS